MILIFEKKKIRLCAVVFNMFKLNNDKNDVERCIIY